MLDSEDSTVTYIVVSSPFGGLSDIGSPGVDRPPMMLEDPYAYVVAAFQALQSFDYVSGHEHPPLPEFVLELIYPESMPPKDEVFLAKEQPLTAAVSPTTESPRYITDFDFEEDPADYPADGEDDDDDGSSDDGDDDDDVEEDEDEDEEEEHLPPIDSIPPPPVHHVTARMSIREHPPTSVWSKAEIDRLLAIPLPPPSPLSSYPTYPLGYRAPIIRLGAETPSTSHPLPSSTPPSGTAPLLSIPLPTLSPPLLSPSMSHKVDVLNVTLPPRKRLCIALGLRYEVGESSSAAAARPIEGFRADYGFGAPTTDETELGHRMKNFAITVKEDTDEIYVRLDDAHDDRALISRRVQSMDTSDLARSEVMTLRTQKMAPKPPDKTPAITTTITTIYVTEAQLKRSNILELPRYDCCPNVAYAMTWTYLRKKMTDKYCPRDDIKKLKGELWNLRVKSNEMVGYNKHFQELALLCVRMFLEESYKVKRFVGGLPDMIHGSVVASRPKTMQEVIEMETELMDKRKNTIPECQAKNKQKFDDTSKNNQNNNNRTRGRIPVGLTLCGLVIRNLLEVLNLYALNETITIMVSVLQNAISAKGLAIRPVTVGLLQVPIQLTTKRVRGQFRNLHALSVEPRIEPPSSLKGMISFGGSLAAMPFPLDSSLKGVGSLGGVDENFEEVVPNS
nr:hypothetical protein [Tanacetum cinerariifolium]